MARQNQKSQKRNDKNNNNRNNEDVSFERFKSQKFHVEFKNPAQKLAWGAFDQHDVVFLLGSAGAGKSHLACAFAVSEILAKRKKYIVLTRPVVEAGGESLGFLPGDLEEKLNPYMIPLFECMDKMVGKTGPQRDILNRSIKIAPIAYQRGRTFDDSVCIFDEAQNATKSQLKLFLTRFGENSKVIVTGDPLQSDIPIRERGLMDTVRKLEDLPGIGIVHFKPCSIVRHPLIASILERLDDSKDNPQE